MEKLIFAMVVMHYIADFPLQGEFLANFKGKFDYLLFSHAVIWTGCICAVLGYFGVFEWWKVAFLIIGHFAVDRWKARKEDKTHSLSCDLWIDQSAHLLQIIAVAVV